LNYIEIKTTVQTPKPQNRKNEQTSSKTSQTRPTSQAGNQTITKTTQSTRQENMKKQTNSWNLRQKKLNKPI
jgi:hypothetical protein